MRRHVLQCVAVCCNVLQCKECVKWTPCVLQCVAVCRVELHSVAVRGVHSAQITYAQT